MRTPARPALEIEIKVQVDNVPLLLQKLAALGALVEGRALERNTLFDTADAYFRRTGCLLRLRSEIPAASAAVCAGKQNALVTFKCSVPRSPYSRYKEKLETEIEIRHPERWDRDLRALGFKPGFRYEKYRSSFRLPGVQLCLDETPIGAFLELEGGPRAIDRTARRLGYGPRDYIRGTYWDLYAADCARRGRSPRNLVFSSVKIR